MAIPLLLRFENKSKLNSLINQVFVKQHDRSPEGVGREDPEPSETVMAPYTIIHRDHGFCFIELIFSGR